MDLSPFSINQLIEIHILSQIREPDSIEFLVEDFLYGGMGICVKVRNVASGNEYALKTIKRDYLQDENAWKMFIEEMKTWITLSACDGVSEAYCLTRINEIPYVCAEWMQGGDLQSKMDEFTPLDLYANFVRIARTLEWVHSVHNIIHRDLKPQNILIDGSGLAYITDWGLARPISKAHANSKVKGLTPVTSSRPELTKAGQFKGTILYASPEQILGNANIDHRSDIYGLGCILYELETGVPPFVGETAEEIAYKHLFEEAPSLNSSTRRTRFGVEGIISKCLHKDPSDRFGTYDSLVSELLRVADLRGIKFEGYEPRERYSMPKIGEGEFQRRLETDDIRNIKSKDGSHSLIEFQDAFEYVREAESLMTLGEWSKASEIYGRLFIREQIIHNPDFDYYQVIAVNYGNCLISLGKPKEAVSVFLAMQDAKCKTDTYYVNLSLAYLHLRQYKEAERTARTGLALFENDKGILGNLIISLTNQDKLDEALNLANRRIILGRDVHILEETASIHRRFAQNKAEKDLPGAIKHYKQALKLLREAKDQNPLFTTARYTLGVTLFDLGQFAEAINELSDVFNGSFTHQTLREQIIQKIARCYDSLGDFQECLEFCGRWLKKLPNNVHLQRVRAETLVDGYCIGQIQEGVRVVERSSLEFFENVVQTENREVTDLCYLARLYEWMGKLNRAFELLEEAESNARGFWEPPYDMAVILWREGRSDEALPLAERACDLAPWRRQPLWLLSKIHESFGNDVKVKELNHRVESLDTILTELYSVA
jgi:serine/threonine protein kinase